MGVTAADRRGRVRSARSPARENRQSRRIEFPGACVTTVASRHRNGHTPLIPLR